MKIKEIEKRYKDEWVLISCKDINENFEVKGRLSCFWR